MPARLVRGRYVVTGARGRAATVVENGAVLVRDGVVAEVGPFAALAGRSGPGEVLGSPDHVVIPGLVNAHHHVGLTPVQLGVPDAPLELWFITRLAGRDVDPYLDTLYSAFEMLGSGVTTVQHIFGWARGGIPATAERIGRILAAYADVGMRVSFALGVRDQNFLSYEPEGELLARLPPALASRLAALLADLRTPLAAQLDLFADLQATYHGRPRSRIQLAPGNLHWCSDPALAAIRDRADRAGALLHVHLVETAYQKEYARRRTGGSALRHLHHLGLAGPRLTLGHATWLDEDDVALAAEAGVHVCHNVSSNLRLRSGVAPLTAFLRRGLNVAIGIDEAGINDDRDMLQEMRLVFHQHRLPGMDEEAPAAAEVLAMASRNGALTTPFGESIGTLEPGRAADLVLLRWSHIAAPYLDPAMPPVDALLYRATAAAVDTVLVAGEPVLRDGRVVRVDRDAVLRDLAASLARPLEPHERERRALARDLLPHVRRFYDRYWDPGAHEPYYRRNSRR
ncbi:MAG: amidohydrolase family protein [Candidatus Rokuibacteriota bacterium]